MGAMSDGNLDEAIKLFGEALECNPHSAVFYAKRAQLLVSQTSNTTLSIVRQYALSSKSRSHGQDLKTG